MTPVASDDERCCDNPYCTCYHNEANCLTIVFQELQAHIIIGQGPALLKIARPILSEPHTYNEHHIYYYTVLLLTCVIFSQVLVNGF